MKLFKTLLVLVFFSMAAPAWAAFNVGVVFENKSGNADINQKSLVEWLKGKKLDVNFEVFNALGDEKAFAAKLAEFEDSKDAILTYRSAAMEYVKKYTKGKKPIIGAATNDPKGLKVIENISAPEGNITAVSHFIPMKEQINVLHQIFPNAKTIGILFEKGHPGGELVELPQTLEACGKLGLKVLEGPIPMKEGDPGLSEEVGRITKDLVAKGAEVIVITNTNSAFKPAKEIIAAAGKIPVYTYAEKAIEAGALGGLVADNEALGVLIGEDLQLIMNGTPIAKIPVKYDAKPKFYLNESKMKELNVTIPFNIMSIAKIIK